MTKTKNNFNLKSSKYLFGFSLISEISPNRFKKICKSFETIEEAWKSPKVKLMKIFGDKTGEKIHRKINNVNLEKELEILNKEKIKIITPKFYFKDFSGINSDLFPERLSHINSSPFVLFAKGNLKILNQNQIGIIGTRRPTHYGKQVLEKLGPKIALSGLIITSGMAIGIDTLAHGIALENKQPTIAVLGSGLSEKILQKSFNYTLSKEIIEKNGLLISEYPPLFSASKFTFPARNRIISGISLGILIVEAAERSGTLITARYALEQNREIFAIPGNIFSLQSVGTNKLIKQGAEPVTSSEDIFRSLNLKDFSTAKKINAKPEFEDDLEELIYNKLSLEPEPIDKLILKCNLDISSISIKLSIMELKGIIKNVGGGYIKN